MRIFVIQILEYLEQYKSDTNCKQEEQKSRNYYTSWIGIRILNPMTKVSTIIPMTSSIIAALMIVVPTLPFSFPVLSETAQ